MLTFYTEDLQVFKLFSNILSPNPLVRCWSCDNTNIHTQSYTEISSLFGHHFPPIRSWSCDNSNIHTQGSRAYWSATIALTNFPLCCQEFPPVRYWLCDNISTYTGCYWSNTGYSCPVIGKKFSIILSLIPTSSVLVI